MNSTNRILKLARRRALLMGLILVVGVPNKLAVAQNDPPRFHVDKLGITTGMFDGNGLEDIVVYREIVDGGDAPWIQLTFDHADLGNSSYVMITSLENGDFQTLNARMMREWNFATGIFHGGKVLVELIAAPEDKGVSLKIGEAVVGENQPEGVEFCGGVDDRVPSNDGRCCRLFFGGCSAFLVSNGAVITAGHCFPLGGVIEFNVPLSDFDGETNPAAIEDQFPITEFYSEFFDDGDNQIGRDWGVFSVGRNSQTGAKAHVAQGFFRCTSFRPAIDATVRITGYGNDSTPLQNHRIQQTSTGPFQGDDTDPDGHFLLFHVDASFSNSGGPVIREDLNIAFGVLTNGGCDSDPDSSNSGTAFELNEFENFINGFWGSNVEQVDQGQPFLTLSLNGSIMRPWQTVGQGVAALGAGGTLVVVEGNYDEPMTITKAMTIQAPAGTVIIGQ